MRHIANIALVLTVLCGCYYSPSLKAEVTQRDDGTIVVAYPSGCRLGYAESGALTSVGRGCSFDERHRAADAVQAWRQEQPRG